MMSLFLVSSTISSPSKQDRNELLTIQDKVEGLLNLQNSLILPFNYNWKSPSLDFLLKQFVSSSAGEETAEDMLWLEVRENIH